jgi:hypothetical protein
MGGVLDLRIYWIRLTIVTIFVAGSLGCLRHSRPQITQTTEPLSFEQARGKCPITLPPEAKNIEYAIRSDVTTIESFVRFDIPYEKGIAYASEVFKEHAKILNQDVDIPQPREITKPPRLDFQPDSDLHVNWFDIDKIRHGVVFGTVAGWKPQIWIDKDRNLFFYCLTD